MNVMLRDGTWKTCLDHFQVRKGLIDQDIETAEVIIMLECQELDKYHHSCRRKVSLGDSLYCGECINKRKFEISKRLQTS